MTTTTGRNRVEGLSGVRARSVRLRIRHPDLPRRFTNRLGPLRLQIAPSLLTVDIVACIAAWLLTGQELQRYMMQALVTIMCMAAFHLYRRRLSLEVLDDVPRLLGSVTIGLAAALAFPPGAVSVTDYAIGVLSSCALFLALLLLRLAGFHAARRMRCKGGVHDLVLIVGAGHVGLQLARNLREHKEYGMAPVGYVDSQPRIADGEELPAPLLGRYEDLAAIIDDFNVSYVMVAFGSLREAALVDILRTCDRMDVDVFIVPRLFELHNSDRYTDDIWGVPLVRVRRAAFRTWGWRVKRFIDVVVSCTALVLLSPVLVACASAVRFEGGPGIIFRQTRVGLDGRPFDVFKFRSLKPADVSESQTHWNIKHDHRLGKVGRFLRRTSLDELPQLWNILRGDMSLVGPRPERPHFVNQFSTHIPRYVARHRVPAGLTGWAQVHGLRGDTSIEDRARFDNYYIENWSLWLDIKIVLRTVSQVLRRQGG